MSLQIECNEPNGSVVRSIRPISRDPDIVDDIEWRMRKVPNFLPQEQTLMMLVSQPGTAFFTVDEIGILGVVDIKQGYYGEAHITFWDKILEGREELCKEVAGFVMESAQLNLLLTKMPVERKRLIEFAERVGFIPLQKHNGKLTMVLLREETSWE